MGRNKIIYDGNVLLDLTGDTVTAAALLEGYTAHNSAGQLVTGTLSIDDLVHHNIRELACVGSCIGSHINTAN